MRPIENLRNDYRTLTGGVPVRRRSRTEDMTATDRHDGVHYAGGCACVTASTFRDVLDLRPIPSPSHFRGRRADAARARFPGQHREDRGLRPGMRAGGRLGTRHFPARARHGDRSLPLPIFGPTSRPTLRWSCISSRHMRGRSITPAPRSHAVRPGNRWSYRTADTYVLELHSSFRERRRPKKDLYDDVVVADLAAAGLSPWPPYPRTYDAIAQPSRVGPRAHGMTSRALPMALAGRRQLHRAVAARSRMLTEALQRAPAARVRGDRRTDRYQHGFYGHDVARTSAVKNRRGCVHGGLRRHHRRPVPERQRVHYVSDGDSFHWRRRH